jgi:hypothetical protein
MDSWDRPDLHAFATPTESLEMGSRSPSVISDLDAGPECPWHPEPHFRHLKIKYDPAWDWEELCKNLFMPEEKYSAVAEHVSSNAHVHLQGTTRLSPMQFKYVKTKWAQTRWEKKLKPSARPFSEAKREVNEKGFQYIMKEGKNEQIFARNLFTDEELEELKNQSVAYRANLKGVWSRRGSWSGVVKNSIAGGLVFFFITLTLYKTPP